MASMPTAQARVGYTDLLDRIVDPVRKKLEVHALESDAYRQARSASADDMVRSVLLPNLAFPASDVFAVP